MLHFGGVKSQPDCCVSAVQVLNKHENEMYITILYWCPSCCHWLLCFRAFFSRCISFGTSQKNKPSGWWNRLVVSLDLWDEMKSLAQVFPKGFPQKDSDTNQRHEDFGNSYFCTIGYVEYLDLTCQALKLKFSIFPDTEVWYKEVCQGWHRSLALQTNWRGKNLWISGSFFWLKPWPWALKLKMRQKLKIISKQTSFSEIGFFPSCICSQISQVIKQGEPGTSFFVIAQGELEVFIKDAQGEEKRATNSGGKTGQIWKSHEDIGLKDHYERSILLKIWKMPSALFAFPCVNEWAGLVGKRFSTWFVLSGSPFQAWNSHPWDGSQISGIWKKWSPKNKTFPYPHTSKMMIQIDERCRCFAENQLNMWTSCEYMKIGFKI